MSVSSAAASAGNPDRAAPGGGPAVTGTARVKRGMADMLKGGVIMDVVTPEQAKIAEDAGAVAVMALERVPADIRAQGGVSRMSAGTRSSAITATAPASSAILACSGVTTSMITPPLSISAMPRLTRAVPVCAAGAPAEDGLAEAAGGTGSDTVNLR